MAELIDEEPVDEVEEDDREPIDEMALDRGFKLFTVRSCSKL